MNIEWFGQESEENKDKPNILLLIKAVDTSHGSWGFTALATSSRA